MLMSSSLAKMAMIRLMAAAGLTVLMAEQVMISCAGKGVMTCSLVQQAVTSLMAEQVLILLAMRTPRRL